jgi:hypothetical protein
LKQGGAKEWALHRLMTIGEAWWRFTGLSR